MAITAAAAMLIRLSDARMVTSSNMQSPCPINNRRRNLFHETARWNREPGGVVLRLDCEVAYQASTGQAYDAFATRD